jgi:hypothetical protein
VRADGRGGVVRRAGALGGSPESGPPLVWLAVGDGRLWASERGTARAFRSGDLAPLARS